MHCETRSTTSERKGKARPIENTLGARPTIVNTRSARLPTRSRRRHHDAASAAVRAAESLTLPQVGEPEPLVAFGALALALEVPPRAARGPSAARAARRRRARRPRTSRPVTAGGLGPVTRAPQRHLRRARRRGPARRSDNRRRSPSRTCRCASRRCPRRVVTSQAHNHERRGRTQVGNAAAYWHVAASASRGGFGSGGPEIISSQPA